MERYTVETMLSHCRGRWWGSSLRFDRAPYAPYWFPGTRSLVERLRFGSLLRPPTVAKFGKQGRGAAELRADGRRRPTSASLALLASLLCICLPTASFVLPMEHIEASLLPIIALSTACFSSRCSRKHGHPDSSWQRTWFECADTPRWIVC